MSNIKFNQRINRHILLTDFKQVGTWLRDNGQFAEETPCLEATEYRLAYHYGSIYLNSCTRYGNEFGSTSGSSRCIIVNKGNFCGHADLKNIVHELYEADKLKGIVPTNTVPMV